MLLPVTKEQIVKLLFLDFSKKHKITKNFLTIDIRKFEKLEELINENNIRKQNT